MVNFGGELKEKIIYEWKIQYIDYEHLKNIIYSQKNNPDTLLESFKTEFTAQVKKVNKFFIDREKIIGIVFYKNKRSTTRKPV